MVLGLHSGKESFGATQAVQAAGDQIAKVRPGTFLNTGVGGDRPRSVFKERTACLQDH